MSPITNRPPGTDPTLLSAERKGDFTSLASGQQFWPLDPRVEDIKLVDIARALSMQCRWGGHVRTFYSVAQHSVMVSRQCAYCPREGLLHDAAEAYLVDVPTPIKKHLKGYYEIEERLLEVIGARFGVPHLGKHLPQEVKVEDMRALATEHRDLRPNVDYWKVDAQPWVDTLIPWGPHEAEERFLARCEALGIR